MALESIQPSTSTENISWGVKKASAYDWHPCHLYVLIVYKFWEPHPPAALMPVQSCDGIALPLPVLKTVKDRTLRCICDTANTRNLGTHDLLLWNWK